MAQIELDFLRRRAKVPVLSWLLLALGIAMLTLVAGRYATVDEAIRFAAAEAGQAAKEARQLPARKVAGTPRPAPTTLDTRLLERPWEPLFTGLEQTRPNTIALLDLEADARKSTLSLTAEAKSPAQMLDYLEALKRWPAFSDVTLSSHVIDDEDAQRPVIFEVKLQWGRP